MLAKLAIYPSVSCTSPPLMTKRLTGQGIRPTSCVRRICEEGWGRSGTEYWERRQNVSNGWKLTYEETLTK
jgi:hypothetical protein